MMRIFVDVDDSSPESVSELVNSIRRMEGVSGVYTHTSPDSIFAPGLARGDGEDVLRGDTVSAMEDVTCVTHMFLGTAISHVSTLRERAEEFLHDPEVDDGVLEALNDVCTTADTLMNRVCADIRRGFSYSGDEKQEFFSQVVNPQLEKIVNFVSDAMDIVNEYSSSVE